MSRQKPRRGRPTRDELLQELDALIEAVEAYVHGRDAGISLSEAGALDTALHRASVNATQLLNRESDANAGFVCVCGNEVDGGERRWFGTDGERFCTPTCRSFTERQRSIGRALVAQPEGSA